MSNKKSGSSFDVERARELSRKLSPGPAPSLPKAEKPAPGYIRFSSGTLGKAAAPAKSAPEPEQQLTPAEQFGPALWNRMLDQCLSAAGAELAFVVDEDGLVVAWRGGPDASFSEGIGARLVIAFEQAVQMADVGSTSQSIAIEFGDRWLTGIRIHRGDNPILTVGVLAPAVVTREVRRAMEKVLQH